MKKLYQEFFQIPEDGEGKIRDKVLLSRIALSFMIMITCMVVMSLSAYAFFTSSITSDMNTITSANYDLMITPPEGISATVGDPNVFVLEGQDNAYDFILSTTEDTTATVGYCKIVVTMEIDSSPVEKVYYTHPIWNQASDTTPERLDECRLQICIPAGKSASVQFIPQWGSCTGTTTDIIRPFEVTMMSAPSAPPTENPPATVEPPIQNPPVTHEPPVIVEPPVIEDLPVIEGEDIVIDVTEPDSDRETKVESVVIVSTTVEKITNANTDVEIKLSDATVSFDKNAIGSIGEQAIGNDVTIVVKEVEQASLNDEQKVALAEKDVYVVLNLEAYAGQSMITEFGGGTVTVSVPFEIPEGKNGDDYHVAYISADGTMTVMPTNYANGVLAFETTHFSSYVVLERDGMDSPETGDSTVLTALFVLMAVCGVSLTLYIGKRKAF